MKIGILSDTHGDLDVKIYEYFKHVDEIWHAGDIGSLAVIDQLRAFKPLRIVYGNIDDARVRQETAEFLRFKAEGKEVLITHIAGKPGKYSRPLFDELQQNGAPDILVCGHSHILLVKMDQLHNMLWVNPGAFGYKGFHQVRTALRFEINGDRVENLEVIEVKR
jgi:putative phosphoesterase